MILRKKSQSQTVLFSSKTKYHFLSFSFLSKQRHRHFNEINIKTVDTKEMGMEFARQI